jgi:hypothetical protein
MVLRSHRPTRLRLTSASSRRVSCHAANLRDSLSPSSGRSGTYHRTDALRSRVRTRLSLPHSLCLLTLHGLQLQPETLIESRHQHLESKTAERRSRTRISPLNTCAPGHQRRKWSFTSRPHRTPLLALAGSPCPHAHAVEAIIVPPASPVVTLPDNILGENASRPCRVFRTPDDQRVAPACVRTVLPSAGLVAFRASHLAFHLAQLMRYLRFTLAACKFAPRSFAPSDQAYFTRATHFAIDACIALPPRRPRPLDALPNSLQTIIVVVCSPKRRPPLSLRFVTAN